MRRCLIVTAIAIALAPALSERPAEAATMRGRIGGGDVLEALLLAEGTFAFGLLAGWWIGQGVAGGCDGRFENSCNLDALVGGAIGAGAGGLLLPTVSLEIWGKVNKHDGSALVAAFGIIAGTVAAVAVSRAVGGPHQSEAFGAGLFILPGLLAGGGYVTTGPRGGSPPRDKAVWSW